MALTFSFEWEIFLIDEEKGVPLKREQVIRIRDRLQFTHPWARHGLDFHHRVDTRLLEIRPGILRSFPEFFTALEKIKTELNRLSKKEKFLPIVSGTVPFAGGVMGLHIHIGTIYSIFTIERRIREILYLVPVWAGLSAASPIYPDAKVGQLKSSRIWENAELASFPNQNTNIGTHLWRWGTDIMDSGIDKPTIQIRIPDAPLSIQFLKEFVTFVVALATSPSSYKLNEERYLEYILNRYNAAKYGLQATFKWLGKEKPLSEIVKELLPKAIKTARRFGYEGDFPILSEMVEKHISQADFILAIHSTTGDEWVTTYEIGKLLRSETDPFVDFLRVSKPLPIQPLLSEEEIVMDNIVKATPMFYLSHHTCIPVARLYSILQNLKNKGEIREHKYLEFSSVFIKKVPK